MNLSKLKSLSGDASFRKFYRYNNTIIVVSKKDTRKNLLIYDAINKLFIKNEILAPKLYNYDFSKGIIVIEDFGDKSFYKILNQHLFFLCLQFL